MNTICYPIDKLDSDMVCVVLRTNAYGLEFIEYNGIRYTQFNYSGRDRLNDSLAELIIYYPQADFTALLISRGK